MKTVGSHQQFNRRAVLQGLSALTTTLTARTGSVIAAASHVRYRLVDTHRHLLSPQMAQFMKDQNMLRPQDNPGAAQMLEEMDRGGVASAILSMMGGPIKVTDAEAKLLAREANEFMAQQVSDHPQRLRFFCMVPLANIDDTLKEIAYAFDTLHADGVSVLTSYGDKWFGDPFWDPVYEELNRRKAFVKTHPHEADCCHANESGVAAPLIEYGTDTTRSIARILFSGTAAKYPDIRFGHSHMGGSFPFLMQRFNNLAQSAGASRIPTPGAPSMAEALPRGLAYEVRKMYFDVAQAYARPTLAAMKEAVPNSQLIFGSDWPYVDAASTFEPVQSSGLFDHAQLEAIASGNIRKAIPGLPI